MVRVTSQQQLQSHSSTNALNGTGESRRTAHHRAPATSQCSSGLDGSTESKCDVVRLDDAQLDYVARPPLCHSHMHFFNFTLHQSMLNTIQLIFRGAFFTIPRRVIVGASKLTSGGAPGRDPSPSRKRCAANFVASHLLTAQ